MRIQFLLSLLAVLFVFTACGNGNDAATSTENPTTNEEAIQQTPHGEGPAYTSAYVCPMHCDGSGAAEMGKCPACGMSYVKQDSHVGDGHQH